MSGLILPGDRPARGGLQILVPRGYETGTGPQKIGECVLCQVEFYDEQAYHRHFAQNARKHASLADEARDVALKKRMPVFDDDTWDPEWTAHMRKVGKRMIREGRMETKPSER